MPSRKCMSEFAMCQATPHAVRALGSGRIRIGGGGRVKGGARLRSGLMATSRYGRVFAISGVAASSPVRLGCCAPRW
jgi:hypothetical protein